MDNKKLLVCKVKVQQLKNYIHMTTIGLENFHIKYDTSKIMQQKIKENFEEKTREYYYNMDMVRPSDR